MPVTEANRAPWRLADHVRACRVDEAVILLDLKRNRYLAVGGQQGQALAQRIDDWPADARAQHLITSVEADALMAPLLEQGLLTREPASTAVVDRLAEPAASLTDDSKRASARSWRRPARLIASVAVTALWLHTRSLAEITTALRARRSRRAGHPSRNRPDPIEQAVASYIDMRPFLLTAHGRCLRDSLALAHFLAGEGLPHALVLGVRTQPFGAHAWVQSGAVVLNDLHEHVRRYRPILVV